MTLQQAAGYQNRKDIPPQQTAGKYQVKNIRNYSACLISILRQSRRYYDCWPLKGA